MMEWSDEDPEDELSTPSARRVYQPNHLVICGGGAKGKAYKEALRITEATGILGGIKNFYGSSVGGLTAAMLAMGMPTGEINKQLDAGPETLCDMFRNNPLSNLSKPIRALKNMIQNKALYKGYKLFEMSQELVARQLGKPNATFKDLDNKVKAQLDTDSVPPNRPCGHLYVTATIMDKRGPYQIVLSHETVPNMPIALALRMTAALPGAFPSIKITPEELAIYAEGATKPLVQYDRGKGFPQPYDPNDVGGKIDTTTKQDTIEICDGGLVENLPQYLVPANQDMLSFNLAHPTYLEHKAKYKDTDLTKVTAQDEKTYLTTQKRSLYYAVKEKYKQMKGVRLPPSRLLATRDTTADFDTDNIMASDFDLTKTKKDHLDQSGREGMIHILKKQSIHSKPAPDINALDEEQKHPEAAVSTLEAVIKNANLLLETLTLNATQRGDVKNLKIAVKEARAQLNNAHRIEAEIDNMQFEEIVVDSTVLSEKAVNKIDSHYLQLRNLSADVERALLNASQSISSSNYLLFKLCNAIPKLESLVEKNFKEKHKIFSQLRNLKDIDVRLKLGVKVLRPEQADRKRPFMHLKEHEHNKQKAAEHTISLEGKKHDEKKPRKGRPSS